MVTPLSRRARTNAHMSRRSSTSTPAVGSSRNRISGSCDRALAIITRRFMPPGRHDLVLRLFHKDRSRGILDVRRVRRVPEQAPAEADGRPHRLERVGGQLLRYQPDLGSGRAVVAHDVVAVCDHHPSVGVTIPQTMLISVVLPAPLGPSRAKISP